MTRLATVSVHMTAVSNGLSCSAMGARRRRLGAGGEGIAQKSFRSVSSSGWEEGEGGASTRPPSEGPG